MVCNHCVAAVQTALTEIGFPPEHVELGRAVVSSNLNDEDLKKISDRLQTSGFELISDPAKDLAESIKLEIIMMIRSSENPAVKISTYLSEKLHTDYRTLSRVFSEVEGRTIETYVHLQKTERVKELLLDGQLTVSEIAWQTGYSSVAHLSRRFKEVTGMTPSEFRRDGHRLPINEV